MVVVAAIFTIAALIWSILFVRKVGLLGGCVMAILMGSCFGYDFMHVDAGPIGVTFDRLFVVFLLLTMGIHAWQQQTTHSRWSYRDGLFLLFVGLLVVNAAIVRWSTGDTTGLAKVLFFFVMPSLLYIIVRQSPFDERSLYNVLTTFAWFGLYLSVMSIAEKCGWWSLVFPRYIVTAGYDEFIGRGRGPFLNPAANGIYITLGLCSLVLVWRNCSRSMQLLLIPTAVVFMLGLYCTLTRCAWLGGALAVLIAVAATVPRRWSIAFVASSIVAASLFVATQWSSLQAFKRDKHVSVSAMKSSASLRPILAKVTWRMFLDRPFLGYGVGRYLHHYEDYLGDGSDSLPLEQAKGYVPHNIFLAVLVEAGLPVMMLFVLVLVVWAKTALDLARRPDHDSMPRAYGVLFLAVGAAFVVNGMFHDVLIIHMVNHLMFLLAGITQHLVAHRDSRNHALPARRSSGRFAPNARRLRSI